jgi:succinate-semialdehyde dehydrogenase/glutarate-semialdehyde dehydrogenase
MIKLKDSSLWKELGLINGAWVPADEGITVEIRNPASGEPLGNVPVMRAAEARRAIEAAHAALPAWSKKTAGERAKIMRKWFDLMLANVDDLAVIMTAEQGKPLAESKGEIAYAASFIEWFAEEGKRIYGDIIPGHQADKRIMVLRQPIGVVAAITPWNFPAAMITRKAGPRLPQAARSSSNPRRRRPTRLWRWVSSRSAPGFRPACSTSSPATRSPSAASSPVTTRYARSPSPGRRPWANYSCSSAPAP